MHVQNVNFKCRCQSYLWWWDIKGVTHMVCRNVYSTWVLSAVRRFNPWAEIFTFCICRNIVGAQIYFFLRQFFMWKNILCPSFWPRRNICAFHIRSILICQVRLVSTRCVGNIRWCNFFQSIVFFPKRITVVFSLGWLRLVDAGTM